MTASHVLSHLSYSPIRRYSKCLSAPDFIPFRALRQAFLSILSVLLIILFTVTSAGATGAEEGGTVKVVHVPIEGTIDLGLPPYVERAVREAEDAGAMAILLEINTLGGRVDAASSIRDALLDCPLTTIAFVNKRAISAGALISLACDSILMAPGSTIGAATPVTIGAGGGEKASEKVVSYWRSEMRATAEETGRDPLIAEAMVDESVVVEDVSDEGKLLTLTTDQAVELGFADAAAESEEEVLAYIGFAGAEVIRMKVNWAEKIVRFFTNPILSGFLLSIGFLGIVMEIRTPGFGLPGIAGITALALFFGAHYIVHLAGNGELILLLAGLVLLALEIFVIPGFGIAGVVGLALLLGTLFSSMIGHLPTAEDLSRATSAMAISMVLSVAGSVLLFKLIPRNRSLSNLVLFAEESRAKGFEVTVESERGLVGMRGLSISGLRPSGVAEINGRRIDVVSDGDYIEAGRSVVVHAVDGNRVVVKEVPVNNE